MKILLMFLLFITTVTAQQFKVTDVKGNVNYRTGTSESWAELKTGIQLNSDDFISTGKNSSIQIKESGNIISIGEFSVVSIASIKKMSTDELLLALAMEDMINAPKTNGNSANTAVYGNKEGNENNTEVKTDDFGIRRLNGAVQLSKNGMMESSVVFAKETYRKYPETKQVASYRIFFADILSEKGLYEEALGEYLDIQKLELSKEQSTKVESQIDKINKILLNN
ncbi:MAG TPA: hypothetical protein VIY47_15405 [Ignavibacteriaceae bacterium]